MVGFYTQLRLEFAVISKNKSDLLSTLLFGILILLIFTFATGPDSELLAQFSPYWVWCAFLLASLLGSEGLFFRDLSSGIIEQHWISYHSLVGYVWIKIVRHWLTTALPIIIFSPVIYVMYDISWPVYVALILTLLVGTPSVSALVTMGAALTVGSNKRSVIQAALLLPIYIPLMIFSSSCLQAAYYGLEYTGALAMLLVCMLISLSFLPLITTSALKANLDSM